jgi:hypothetical protein
MKAVRSGIDKFRGGGQSLTVGSGSNSSSMFSWVWENKEWLFSGAGVAVICGIIALWRSKHRPPQTVISVPEDEYFPIADESDPPLGRFWFIAQKLPGLRGLAARRIFTEREIVKRLRITVSGEGDGMSFWKFNNQGKLNVRLEFVNFNPFSLVVDRITGNANVGGSPVASLGIMDRYEIAATSHRIVPIEVGLNAAQVEQIEFQLRQRADAPGGMDLKVYLETPVRSAMLQRQLATGNCRFLNFQVAPSPR